MSDEAMVTDSGAQNQEGGDELQGHGHSAAVPTANGCADAPAGEADDPSNFLLSSKTKLSHMSEEEREHLNSCLRSRRVLTEEDLMTLSESMEPKCWKEVANGLKFNFMAVEKWNESEESDAQKIHQMLLSWLHWKEDKATVGRLAKALFLNDQMEAIECLTP